MLFGLTFTGNVDPTALATFVLAGLTLAAVIVGGKALTKTQSAIDLSRREVEEAHRPVVVPLVDGLHADGDWLFVPIKNIGLGPALDVEVGATLRDDAGNYTEAAGPERIGAVAGLGVSDVRPIEIRIPHLGAMPNFDVRVMYSDVAEKPWVTTAKYLRADGRYTGLRITAGEGR